MKSTTEIFDRRALRRNRARASQNIGMHDFLFANVGKRLVERLDAIRRIFPQVLDLGCHTGQIKNIMEPEHDSKFFINCDPCEAMARAAGTTSIVADEEQIPIADQSLDLVLSSLSLHWVNDLPRALAQILRCLRADGLFLGAMFGANTLGDLRQSLISSTNPQDKEFFPRVSPFIEIRELGNILQRVGFAMPVIDVDHIKVCYPDLTSLMEDLRGMGETNILNQRCKHFTARTIFQNAATFYPTRKVGCTGTIEANFEILYAMGWAPHANQQLALRRGTGAAPLEKILAP